MISAYGFTSQPIVVTFVGANDEPDAIVDSVVYTIGKVLANENDPVVSDDFSVSALVAGATLGRVTDNRDGTVTYNPNAQFQHLIDGETVTTALNRPIRVGRGEASTAMDSVTISGVWNFTYIKKAW
ncbi:MAG: hypothetical protein GY859_28315 [Desulfobacterales bacterium]|nr:hypothetical protein [Desulfobacterales bacterium]